MTCDLREIPFPFPQRMLCKKLPRKWRIVRMLLSRRKLLKNNEDCKNFARSMIRNREQWVYSSPILSSYDIPTFLIKTLITWSCTKPSREVGMPRNTREHMSIPGNVFDRQHAQRDSDKVHNDSRNLATFLTILRTSIEKNGSEESLQSIPLPCFSVRADERKSLDDKKVLCLWLTMPWVFGLVLKWHDNSVLSPLGAASAKYSLTKRNFKAGSWISKQKFTQKRRISRSYCSGSRDRSNQLAEGPHQIEINHEKDFPDYEELDPWWRQSWHGATALFIWSTQ